MNDATIFFLGGMAVLIIGPSLVNIVLRKVFKVQFAGARGYAGFLEDSNQADEIVGYHAIDRGRGGGPGI